jgi:hypothetical protein
VSQTAVRDRNRLAEATGESLPAPPPPSGHITGFILRPPASEPIAEGAMHRQRPKATEADSAPPVSTEARMCLGYLASGSTQFVERPLVASFPITILWQVKLLVLVIFNAGAVLVAPAVPFSIEAARSIEAEYRAACPDATSAKAGQTSAVDDLGAKARRQRYFQARSIRRARALMKGETAFITDATCGIGKVSALTLEPAF